MKKNKSTYLLWKFFSFFSLVGRWVTNFSLNYITFCKYDCTIATTSSSAFSRIFCVEEKLNWKLSQGYFEDIKNEERLNEEELTLTIN